MSSPGRSRWGLNKTHANVINALRCQMDSVTWRCRGLGASGQQRFGIPAAPPADGWGPLTPLLRYDNSICLSISFIYLSLYCWYSHLADHMNADSRTLSCAVSGCNRRPSSWLLKSNIACDLACIFIQSVCPTAMKLRFLIRFFIHMFV